jgi:hypothetical protein
MAELNCNTGVSGRRIERHQELDSARVQEISFFATDGRARRLFQVDREAGVARPTG